jgi:hypothetical protein
MSAVQNPGTLPVDDGDRKAASTAAWLRSLAVAGRDTQFALHMLYGGRDGVLGVGETPSDSLKARATVPASLQIDVLPGAACAFEAVVRRSTGVTTPAFPVPTTNPRIDLVQFSLSARAVSVKAGAEAEVPVAPTADADCIPLATVYLRTGATAIKDSDDTVNGYLVDARTFVNL